MYINRIAEMAHLHHQTSKRVIESIFVIQRLAPVIDLHYLQNGRVEVELMDMPAYFCENLDIQKRVLGKLYSMRAFFGHKAPIEILSKEEEIAISGLKRDLLIDVDDISIGLSVMGAESAFEIMEHFMEVQDLIFNDPELATSQLRRFGEQEEREEMSLRLGALEAVSEQLSAVSPENLAKSSELQEAVRSFLSSPEARYIQKISREISRINLIIPKRAYRSKAEDHSVGILP